MSAAERAAECEAQGDEAGARYWRQIEHLVDQAPPLVPEQMSRLRVLIPGPYEAQANAA
ncbi:hypothetical protein [Streptomyces sp. NPDC057403]|uniref:hypothetical protein n=1 Tax=Streptomyces sp. NPDC057403 TaxID=3346119 RepID=UPI0036B0D44E